MPDTEARLTRATIKGDAVVFRVAVSARILIGSGIFGLLILIVKSIGKEGTWLLIAGSILVILMCFGWPATIVTEKDALGVQVKCCNTTSMGTVTLHAKDGLPPIGLG